MNYNGDSPKKFFEREGKKYYVGDDIEVLNRGDLNRGILLWVGHISAKILKHNSDRVYDIEILSTLDYPMIKFGRNYTELHRKNLRIVEAL